MKVNWFHLMPYRFLPANFENDYHSVWVDIPARLFDPMRGHNLYNEFLDELEFADQMGFDGICVNEHHANAYGMMPSPNLMAAAIARRTTNANLIVLGNSIAMYNPPLRVAEEFAMLDLISGGRLVAGFPVGSSPDDNFAYGFVPATLRERYYEAHDFIKKAWTEQTPFVFNGRYNKVRYTNMFIRPLQKPHPPIWIPGGGSVETWDWTLDHDYVYCALSYLGYEYGKRVGSGYWERCAAKGMELNPYRFGYLQLICVAETDAQAEKDYAEHLEYFYNKCVHIAEEFADAPGYRTEATIRAGLRGQGGNAATMFRKGLKWKDFVDRAYVIAGSPATVRDKLSWILKDLKVGQLMALQQIGSMPKHLVLKNTELFAKEVMPSIKKIWDEEWEDRWSPRPLPGQQRAVAGQAEAH